MHAIHQIHVPVSGFTKHNLCARRFPARGVTRAIVKAVVRLGFYDFIAPYSAAVTMHKVCAEEHAGNYRRFSCKKHMSQYHVESANLNKKSTETKRTLKFQAPSTKFQTMSKFKLLNTKHDMPVLNS